jgi:hypothetical protein
MLVPVNMLFRVTMNNLCVLTSMSCLFVLIYSKSKNKAVPLHAMEALGGRGGVTPTHS